MIIYEVTAESLVNGELGRQSFGLYLSESKAKLEVERIKSCPYERLYFVDINYTPIEVIE